MVGMTEQKPGSPSLWSSNGHQKSCWGTARQKHQGKTGSNLVNFSDVQNIIAYHTRALSDEVVQFLLRNPSQISLRCLIDFWLSPSNIDHTSGRLASSLCGSSWYLALNYLIIGKVEEAKAFVLNGSFLQQCYNSSIQEVADVCHGVSTLPDSVFEEKLPYFRDAIIATRSVSSMKTFLEKVMPSEYQRMMSFASQNSTGPMTRYVDLINDDWNGFSSTPSSVTSDKQKGKNSNETDSEIDIIIFNTDTQQECIIKLGVSTTMKSLFNDYSEKQAISLKSLRFTYKGKTIFLSSIGNKTPSQLELKDHDVINVSTVANCPPREETTSFQCPRTNKPKQSSLKRPKKNGKRKNKSKSGARSVATSSHEDCNKLHHSKLLSLIFEEAEPKFKEIRQRLNALNIERTQPKQKTKKAKSISPPIPEYNMNPNIEDLGGKAGKPQYLIQVGEVENLYKTTKPSKSIHKKSLSSMTSQSSRSIISLDLHGYTKQEALTKLQEKLPQWIDIAMRGSYPWVIPVMVICGGGNQVLSETVDNWIRQNENVSNAPKNFIPSR